MAMNYLNKTNIYYTNSISKNINTNKVSFRGESVSLPEIPNDKFETSKSNNITPEKKGMSNSAKLAIGIGTLIGTIATVTLIIKKNKYSEVKQLAENISFEKAKTIEDAINWGKKNLGIKHYGGFEAQDLEAINWINEGLTNTSNKMKGKLRIPKSILYTDKVLGENSLAGVVKDATGEYAKYNGQFYVNKNIFRNIDTEINRYSKELKEIIDVSNNQFTYCNWFAKEDMNILANDIRDFKNGKITNFDRKLTLYESMDNLAREVYSINESPFSKIRQIVKNENLLDILKKNNLETDLEKIKNMSLDEQSSLLNDIMQQLKGKVVFKHTQGNQFRTIYHEMGHLQDNIPRTPAKGKYQTAAEYPKELKEWLDNSEYIETASRVSEYSTTGPGEFIAETFADMICGNKIPEEVSALYKKLNGPKIL